MKKKSEGRGGLRVKSGVKAGALTVNHNETLMRDRSKVSGMRVKSGVKAGGVPLNHNETLVRDVG